jgi:tetratricopeptide (TPR) repeat protein
MAWQLLREKSPRGAFVRRRIAGLAAACVFFGGLLIALGLGTLLLFLVVVGAAGGGVLYLVRRGLPRGLPQVDLSGVRRHATRGATSVRAASTRVARDVRARSRAVEWQGWPYAGGAPVAADDPDAEHRRALELNARGARLRSEGRAEAAAEQHRQALAIFRKLGDRGGEAPTLNSLALALEASGDTDAAVERFEQALTILRDEGDERHEGRVIANLGFTMLRHGEDDRARDLLETALEKLDPESRTAQQVVEQLRRAS